MGHDIEKARNMKLILSTFEQFQGSKLSFTKVKSFVLVKQRIMRCFIRSCLGVGWVIPWFTYAH
jgi:hypothetical protein